MALNFGGLGFVVSAVDKGAKATLRGLSAGFGKATEAAVAFGKGARGVLGKLKEQFKPMESSAMEGRTKATEGFFSKMKEGAQGAASAVTGLAGKVTDFVSGAIRKFGELTLGVGRFAGALASRAITGGLRAAGAALQATGSQAARTMGALTQAPTNLTTSMEASMQAHTDAVRRMGVQYGFLGRDLRTFTRQTAGMADSLNIGDEAAAQAVRGFREAGGEFRAVGLGSARLVAQFSNVTGVSADVLRDSLVQARSEFGFTDADLRTLTNSTVAYGRTSGDVAGSLQNLGPLLQQVRTNAAQAGTSMNAQQLAEYAASVNRTAAAFYAVSGVAGDARTGAMELASSLLQSQRQMGDVFAGTRDNIAEAAQEIGIATGDVEASFALMQQGPAGFTAGMTRMVQAVRGSGGDTNAQLNALRARLDSAFGPEQSSRLMTLFQRASADQLQTMTTSAADNTGVLRRMATEGFSTGRTLQEEFDRMQQGFVSGFRSISRNAVGGFMRDTGRAFSQFNSGLRDIVAQGGPLASVIEQLSLAHQIGPTAFLPPDVRPFAAAIGGVAEGLTPAVTALGSLGFRVGMLANPLVLLGAVIAFVALKFGALFLKTRDAGRAFEILEQQITDGAASAASFVERLVPMVVRAIPLILGAFGRIVQIAIPAAIRIGAAILQGLGQIGIALLRWAVNFDWGSFLESVFEGLAAVARGSLGLARMFLGVFVEIIQSIDFRAAGQRLVGVFTSIFGALRNLNIQGMAGNFARLGTSILDLLLSSIRAIPVSSVVSTLTSTLGTALGMLSSVLGPLLRGLGGAIGEALPFVGGALRDILVGGMRFLTNLDYQGILNPITDGLADGLTSVIRGLPSFAGMLIDGLLTGTADLSHAATPILGALQHFLSRAITVLVDEGIPALSSLLTRVAAALPGILRNLLTFVMDVMTELPTRITPLLHQLGASLQRVLPGLVSSLLNAITDLIGSLPGLLWTAISRIPELMRNIGPLIQSALVLVRNAILGVFEGVRQWLVSRFPQSASTITAVFDTIRLVVTNAFTTIQVAAAIAWGALTAGVTLLVGAVRRFAEALWADITRTFEVMGTVINTVLVEPVMTAWGWITRAAEVSWNFIRDNVFTPLRSAWESVVSFMDEHFSGAMTSLRSAFGSVMTWIEEKLNYIAGPFRALGSTIDRVLHRTPAPETPATPPVVPTAEQRAAREQRLRMEAQATEQARQAGLAAVAAARGRGVTSQEALRTIGTTAAQGTLRQSMQAQATAAQAQTSTASSSIFGSLFSGLQTPGADMSAHPRVARGALAGAAPTFQGVHTATLGNATATATAVSEAFTNGLTGVMTFTRSTFIPRQTEAFTRMTTAISALFRTFLTGLLNATDAVFNYLIQQAAEVVSRVGRAMSAAQTLQVAEATAGRAAGVAVDARAQNLGTRDAALNDIYNATMHPDWYERDFKQLFASKMDALTDAVRAGGGARGPAGGRVSRGDVDRAIDRGLRTVTAMPSGSADENGSPQSASSGRPRSTRSGS